jgi:acetyltransferase-like isoleucine patch superfamily enzyme
MILTRIIKASWRLYVQKSGSDLKIKYFRRQGMKVGIDCLLNTMFFSDPFLVELGDHVTIAEGTYLITHDDGISRFREEFPGDDIFGKIVIGNNVFIGINCTILPNTTISDNCIIGAGSVVRGKFPANSVIFGNPAKVVTTMNAQKLLYRYSPGRIRTANMTSEEKIPVIIKHFNGLR